MSNTPAEMLALMYQCTAHATTTLRNDMSIDKKACHCEYKISGTPTLEQWNTHYTGVNAQLGLGLYTTTKISNEVRFGMIDVDIFKSTPDEYGMIEKPTDVQTLIIEYIKQHNLPLLPFYSRSGGLHLTIYFKEDVPASEARKLLGLYICEMYEAGIFNAVAKVNRRNLPAIDIEIFPKQDEIDSSDGFGNFVWAPFMREGHLNHPTPHISRPVDGRDIQGVYKFYQQQAQSLDQIEEALDGQLSFIKKGQLKFSIKAGYPKIKLDEDVSLGSTANLPEVTDYENDHEYAPYFYFEGIDDSLSTQAVFADIATFITKQQDHWGFSDDQAEELYHSAVYNHRQVLSNDVMRLTKLDENDFNKIWDRRHTNQGYINELGKNSYFKSEYDATNNTINKMRKEKTEDDKKELRVISDRDLDMLDGYVCNLTDNITFYPTDRYGVDVGKKLSYNAFNSTYARKFSGTTTYKGSVNMVHVYQDLKPHLIGKGITYEPYEGYIYDGAVNSWRDNDYKRGNTKIIKPSESSVIKTIDDEVYILCSGILQAGGDKNDLREAMLELKMDIAYTVAAQNKKLKRCVLLYGPTGTGKSTMIDIMAKAISLYNYALIRGKRASSRFNAKEAEKALIHYAELSVLNDDTWEAIKDRITSDIIPTEKKKIDEIDLKDYANRFITSNKPNFYQVPVTDGRIETFISGPLPHNAKQHFKDLHSILNDDDKIQEFIDWACAIVHNYPDYDITERKPQHKGTMLMQGYSTLSDLAQNAYAFLTDSDILSLLPYPTIVPVSILTHAICGEGKGINANPDTPYYNYFLDQDATNINAANNMSEAFTNAVRSMYVEDEMEVPAEVTKQVVIGPRPQRKKTKILMLPGYNENTLQASVSHCVRENLCTMYDAGFLPKVKQSKNRSVMKPDTDLYNIIMKHKDIQAIKH